MTRKFGSRAGSHGTIPKEVMQAIGSAPIDARTRVTMIRCGNRILVVAQAASGIQPLTEITGPEEVRALTAACLGDSKQKFVTALKSIEQENTADGFLAEHPEPSAARSRGRLFASA